MVGKKGRAAAHLFLPAVRSAVESQRGQSLAVVAFSMVVIMGMAALAIDTGMLLNERTKLQATADASALAAAQEIPNETAARAVAAEYANTNHPGHGMLVDPAEVKVGNWDPSTGTFTPGGSPTNAVQVWVRRRVDRDNAVPTFFARLIGNDLVDVSARATAEAIPDCFSNGLVAGNTVTLGQDIRLDNYCIYGRNGVGTGQDPHLNNGAALGALDRNTITTGQDPRCNGGPIEPCLVEDDLWPTLAQQVSTFIDNVEAGSLPPGITGLYVGSSLPGSLQEGHAYVINGNVTIGQDYHVKNVIIAARGNVTWGQDGAVRNSGSPSADPAIGIYATEDIQLGQDARAIGVHLIAGDDFIIGQDIRGLDAAIQAGDQAIIQQDPHFTSTWPGFQNGGTAYRLVQ
jgi:hypothetical protein